MQQFHNNQSKIPGKKISAVNSIEDSKSKNKSTIAVALQQP